MQSRNIVESNRGILGDDVIIPNPNIGYRVTKRAIDVIGSTLLLTALSPVMLITMIIIKLENPRANVFYKQPRAGKGSVAFHCYKFRTMNPNADEVKDTLANLNEMDGPVFKIKDDPRVTGVGRRLRRYSIDELPQLLHVLLGKMSLVGPRPLPVAEAAACNERQKLRELVKPGCVCYWQVSGRNEISFEEWMELDIRYVQEMSFGTDIKILFKTIPAVFSKKGAY